MGKIIPPYETLHIPAKAFRLEGFRAWAQSRAFPEHGRIDFLEGDLEIDMSPEDLYTHGTVKTAITATLHFLVAEPGLGYVVSDRSRVSSPQADLSAEPDVVVLFWGSIERGQVKEVPSAKGEPGRYVELEGAPDLVVEVISDSSVRKDRRRLPGRYAAAGVPELWLVDARSRVKGLQFEIRTLEAGAYRLLEPDAEGWIPSPLLGRRFRLTRRQAYPGRWTYLLEREEA